MGKVSVVAAVDPGSVTVRVSAATYDRAGRLKGLSIGRARARGIARGMVTDLSAAAHAIAEAKGAAERAIGREIDHAWIGLSGGHVVSSNGTGRVEVFGEGHEIDDLDVRRALIASEVAAVAAHWEALHVIPLVYQVDSVEGVTSPLGMFGSELGVEARVISGEVVHTQNVLRAARRAGLTADGLVYGPVAAAAALMDPIEHEQGVLVLDIGRDSTDVAVFQRGIVVEAFSLPVAAGHFDRDLAYGFKITPGEAERLKIGGLSGFFAADAGENPWAAQALFTQVIRARAEELFEVVLERLGDSRLQCAVLTGGGSRMVGLVALAEEVLGLPCRIGEPVLDVRTGTPEDSVLFGLLEYGLSRARVPGGAGGRLRGIREWLLGGDRRSRESHSPKCRRDVDA